MNNPNNLNNPNNQNSAYLNDLLQLQATLKWLLNKELLSQLVELQTLLNNSFLSKYQEYSTRRGGDCAYIAKAKELFLLLQEKEIAKKIEDIYKTYIQENK